MLFPLPMTTRIAGYVARKRLVDGPRNSPWSSCSSRSTPAT